MPRVPGIARASRLLTAFALVAVVAPLADAAEPSRASALWREDHGGEDVLVMSFVPDAIDAGQPFGGYLRFAPGADVVDVRYQICEIGQVCFAIGVPMTETSPGNWTFHTSELEAFIGRPAPTFGEGDRIGVQFFVYNSTSAGEDAFRFFPEGDECDVFAPDEEWVACQETHYFGVTMGPPERRAGASGFGLGVLALAGLVVAARGRSRD